MGSKGEFLLRKEIKAKLLKFVLRRALHNTPVSGSIHQVIGVTLQYDVCQEVVGMGETAGKGKARSYKGAGEKNNPEVRFQLLTHSFI